MRFQLAVSRLIGATHSTSTGQGGQELLVEMAAKRRRNGNPVTPLLFPAG